MVQECSQKVIIGLSINGNDKKSRSKAFKIAVSQPGVNSAAIKCVGGGGGGGITS
ncbi:hypothetical protein P3S68_008243 [Capsicum galapagoense]